MTGPHGEKRPADPIANAVHVMRIATDEAEEEYVHLGKRRGGLNGRPLLGPKRSHRSSAGRSPRRQRRHVGNLKRRLEAMETVAEVAAWATLVLAAASLGTATAALISAITAKRALALQKKIADEARESAMMQDRVNNLVTRAWEEYASKR